MTLRALAESDLGYILEGDATGFKWPVTVTNPAGTSSVMDGFTDDISQLIDPDTGQAISGRLATVALRTSTLEAGLGLPVGVADESAKPWTVEFNDIGGTAQAFKIREVNPDRALGLTVCVLEFYQAPVA